MSGKHEVDLHTNIWKVPSDVKSLLLSMRDQILVCSNMTVAALINDYLYCLQWRNITYTFVPSMKKAYMLAYFSQLLS